MMVAWHEVPGKAAIGDRPGGYSVMGYAPDLRFGVGPNVSAAITASNTAGAGNSVAEEVAKQQTSVTEQEDTPSLIPVQVLGYGGRDE
jgi:hypothetical protein